MKIFDMKYILILFLFCYCCSQTTKMKLSNKNVDTGAELILIDSIEINDELIQYKYYSDTTMKSLDSIKIFYRNNRQLESIFYMGNSERYISKGYFNNGNAAYVRFSYSDRDIQKNDTLFVTYHVNGTVKSLEICKQDSFVYPTSFTSYYMDGNLKEKGEYNTYNIFTVPSGVWLTYDSLDNNRVIEKIHFHPDEQGKDYIIETSYNKNGKIKSQKIFNNYVLYETDPIELKEIPK